jgi:MFS family permease
MNKDVAFVSFSAFFADLGYQTALAVFPIFLVLVLGAPAYSYGIASAIAYGIGSAFGYLGGLLSDRFSDKKIAILGNALIPIISLMGLAKSPTVAILLFSGGWWARNFRTPSRRTILVDATSESDRGKVFGFLHALDIGGGMLSVVLLLYLVYIGFSYSVILLLTILPLVISTILLAFTSEDKRKKIRDAKVELHPTTKAEPDAKMEGSAVAGRTYRGIIIATALYGFSSYSLGFPILTIAQSSNAFLGIGSYAVYLGVSAIAGYYIGSRIWRRLRTLSTAGYILSGFGTFLLGFAYLFGLGVQSFYLAVAILGFGLGVIETLEPTLISLIKTEMRLGQGMGALAASRSFGIFSANIIMGVLYAFSVSASYFYAAIISILAGLIVLGHGKGFEK